MKELFYRLISNACMHRDGANFIANSARAFLDNADWESLIDNAIKDRHTGVLGEIWSVMVLNKDFKQCRKFLDLVSLCSPEECNEIFACGGLNLNIPKEFVVFWLTEDTLGSRMKKDGKYEKTATTVLTSDGLVWLLDFYNSKVSNDSQEQIGVRIILDALLRNRVKINSEAARGWIERMAISINNSFQKDKSLYGLSERNYTYSIEEAGSLMAPMYAAENNNVESKILFFNVTKELSEKCPGLWQIKNFFAHVMNSLKNDEDKLIWFKQYEEYAERCGDKKCQKSLKDMKVKLDSGKMGPVQWWEKLKLERTIAVGEQSYNAKTSAL